MREERGLRPPSRTQTTAPEPGSQCVALLPSVKQTLNPGLNGLPPVKYPLAALRLLIYLVLLCICSFGLLAPAPLIFLRLRIELTLNCCLLDREVDLQAALGADFSFAQTAQVIPARVALQAVSDAR